MNRDHLRLVSSTTAAPIVTPVERFEFVLTPGMVRATHNGVLVSVPFAIRAMLAFGEGVVLGLANAAGPEPTIYDELSLDVRRAPPRMPFIAAEDSPADGA